MAQSDFAPFAFAGHEWRIAASRALFWPAENAVLVADLHLEKASWYAQSGQMLPPYDSRETLERLTAAIASTGARRVLCLGDNFHDDAGPTRMEPQAKALLAALSARVDLVWITGNHDAALSGIPVPGFSSALSYYDSLASKRLPASLVQAQRDFFGAHTYRRVDRDGSFHTEWTGDRSETAL